MGVGMKVKEIRERRGYTQKGLAKRAAVSSTYVQRLEAGEYESRGPSRTYLTKLADALEVSIAELVGDTDPERAIAEATPPDPRAQLIDSIFKALDEPYKD